MDTEFSQNFTYKKLNNNKLIIFSHGFGVKWDSKGMFTDIAEKIDGFDFIFFDYIKSDKSGNTYMRSIEEQILIYKKALDLAQENNYEEINVISHSFGAVVPLKFNSPLINRFIMIAPPTGVNKEEQLRMLKQKPGSVIDLNNYSSIPRSDGTTTYIHYTFYDSIVDLNMFKMMNDNLSKQKSIITAIEDEIVSNDYTNSNLDSNIRMINIHGDHNFRNDFRIRLIDTIKALIT